MVSVSASVNLPLHHKVQKFCSGTGSPGWSRKKGRKMVVMVVWLSLVLMLENCRRQIIITSLVANNKQWFSFCVQFMMTDVRFR